MRAILLLLALASRGDAALALSNVRGARPTLRARMCADVEPAVEALPSIDTVPVAPVDAAAASGLNPLEPLAVLWRFSRPHTMIGSALCIPALSLYAVPPGAPVLSGALAGAVLFALVPSLLINIYVVGLNQLYDVEIDKVNKPNLPLASGEMTVASGNVIVGASLVVGLLLGWSSARWSSAALRLTLVGSALLGTIYSLPPFRLKRSPLLASLAIMSVRGALINFGFFWHASAALLGGTLSAAALAAQRWRCLGPVLFYCTFGVVIALVKDVPDVAGDRLYGIRSFSVRLGQAQVLRFATTLLSAALVVAAAALGAAAAASTSALAVGRRAAVAALGVGAAWYVQRRRAAVDAAAPGQVYEYYMFLWAIFYASYLCLPFAR